METSNDDCVLFEFFEWYIQTFCFVIVRIPWLSWLTVRQRVLFQALAIAHHKVLDMNNLHSFIKWPTDHICALSFWIGTTLQWRLVRGNNINNYLVYTTQVNSTFRARWLASSEVISQVLFTSEQPEKNKMAFVCILSW